MRPQFLLTSSRLLHWPQLLLDSLLPICSCCTIFSLDQFHTLPNRQLLIMIFCPSNLKLLDFYPQACLDQGFVGIRLPTNILWLICNHTSIIGPNLLTSLWSFGTLDMTIPASWCYMIKFSGSKSFLLLIVHSTFLLLSTTCQTFSLMTFPYLTGWFIQLITGFLDSHVYNNYTNSIVDQ